jgi:hypothetical protein
MLDGLELTGTQPLTADIAAAIERATSSPLDLHVQRITRGATSEIGIFAINIGTIYGPG